MERRFCCAKSVACGRVIEREWGNPQRFPPHTPPSLRYARVRTTKPEGRLPHLRLAFALSFRASDRCHWRGNPHPPSSPPSVREVSTRSIDGGIVTFGRTESSTPTIVYRTCALLLPCHSEPVTDVTGVGIRILRPLPLPLGEVAERSEDGEGKQRRAASRRPFFYAISSAFQHFSNTTAVPIPPPMHRVARPFLASGRFCISCSRVTMIRAPDAPTG